MTIGPSVSVKGEATRASPGMEVVPARLAPDGAHTRCVTKGFSPWLMAYGHQRRNHTIELGSAPQPK